MDHEITPPSSLPSSLPEITKPEILPLEENGHRLALGDKPEAEVYFLSGHPQVSRVAWRCAICDERPSYTVADKVLQVTNPCPYSDGFTTEITLRVPSGKLLVTDDLRPIYNWDDSTFASYNSALGQAQAIKAMAAAGCAYGPVGNSCPSLYRIGTDTYVIANIDDENEDEEDATPGDPETNTADLNERTRLAVIVTDLWAYSIADFEDWKSRGGAPGTRGWSDTIVDVTPGTYRFVESTPASATSTATAPGRWSSPTSSASPDQADRARYCPIAAAAPTPGPLTSHTPQPHPLRKDEPMDPMPGHPHGRHFRHCFAYVGSFCSCGGQYTGYDAGPRLDLPPASFSLLAPRTPQVSPST